MLRPVDASKGNHKLLYEVTNRGRKFLMNWIMDVPAQAVSAVNDPMTEKDAGNALFFRQGWTLKEIYSSHAIYLSRLERSVQALVRDRLLLAEDADRYLQAARDDAVVKRFQKSSAEDRLSVEACSCPSRRPVVSPGRW